jgi:hypothetical protein
MFTHQTISELQNTNLVLSFHNDLSEKEKIDMKNFVETNLSNPGSRSPDQVKMDSIRGLMCEYALDRTITNIQDFAPITKNAKGLSYAERQTDKVIDGKKVQIKSWEEKYFTDPRKILPLSPKQYKSVKHAADHNEVFIIMGWTQIQKMRYRCKVHFVVPASEMLSYIRDIDWRYSKVGVDISRLMKYNRHIQDLKEESLYV